MIITINNLERNTADDTVVTAHWNALKNFPLKWKH